MTNGDRDERKAKISLWIRRGMEERGLTQGELADYIGVAGRTVSAWIHAKDLPISDNIQKVREAFGELPTVDEEGETSNMVKSPLQCIDCSMCSHAEECFVRVCHGYPAMCESLSEKDLRWAKHNGVLQGVIWWEDIDTDDSFSNLVEDLDISSEDLID